MERVNQISYVCIDMQKTVLVSVKYSNEITNYSISPISKAPQSRKDGQEVRFRLARSGYYLMEVNNSDKLILFAEKQAKKDPVLTSPATIDVRKYVAGPGVLQTRGLQTALNGFGSGKILYFPPGEYCTGTLIVKSNTTVYLAKGAIIKGSGNREDYPSDLNMQEADQVNHKESYTDNGEFMTFSRLLLIDNAKNVRIYGHGMIDGNGAVLRSQGKPANLIRIRRSENITLEGIFLVKSCCLEYACSFFKSYFDKKCENFKRSAST